MREFWPFPFLLILIDDFSENEKLVVIVGVNPSVNHEIILELFNMSVKSVNCDEIFFIFVCFTAVRDYEIRAIFDFNVISYSDSAFLSLLSFREDEFALETFEVREHLLSFWVE